MSSRFSLIYTRVPGRPGDQRILTERLVAPGFSEEDPTPFAWAKLFIARDWGIDVELDDPTLEHCTLSRQNTTLHIAGHSTALSVTGPPFGDSSSTLVTSEMEWYTMLDRLNNKTEAVTFTLCSVPTDVTLEELNMPSEKAEVGETDNLTATSSFGSIVEALRSDLATLKLSAQAQLPDATQASSRSLTEVLTTLKALSDAYAAQALELATLKLTHQATTAELAQLKILNQQHAQQLALTKAAGRRKTFVPQQATDIDAEIQEAQQLVDLETVEEAEL